MFLLGASALALSCGADATPAEGTGAASSASVASSSTSASAAASTSSSGGAAPLAADAVLGADRDATFDGLMRVFDFQRVAEDGLARLGTSFSAELARARERFERAETKEDAYYALLSFQRSYHDGHSELDLPPALVPSRPPVALPITVRLEYDDANQPSYTIVASQDTSLPIGAHVAAEDGVSVADLEAVAREFYPEGSSPDGVRRFLASWLAFRDPYLAPSPNDGDASEIALDDGGVVTLTWKTITGSFGSSCPPFAAACSDDDPEGDYASRSPEFVGMNYCIYPTSSPKKKLIRYYSFYYPDPGSASDVACVAPKLPSLSYALDEAGLEEIAGPHAVLRKDQAELLAALAADGADEVVFDVRGNGGGDFDPAFFGAFAGAPYSIPLKELYYGPGFRADPSLIADADLFLATVDAEVSNPAGRFEQYLKEHPGAIYSDPYPFYCTTDACDPSEATYPPASVGVTAHLLVDALCFSSCDDFVSIFRDNGIADTAGVPSGAGDSPFRYVVARKLADGSEASFTLTVGASFHMDGSGLPIEAHPAAIDVPLPPTAANRGKYLDTALAALGF